MIKKNINNVVIGSSWLIGTTLLNNLRERGQEVVAAASSSSSVNSLTREGLTGAKVVRHAGRPSSREPTDPTVLSCRARYGDIRQPAWQSLPIGSNPRGIL